MWTTAGRVAPDDPDVLEYKPPWYFFRIIVIDPAHTSQTCSACQAVDSKSHQPFAVRLHQLRVDLRRRRQCSEEYFATRHQPNRRTSGEYVAELGSLPNQFIRWVGITPKR